MWRRRRQRQLILRRLSQATKKTKRRKKCSTRAGREKVERFAGFSAQSSLRRLHKLICGIPL
jgi:hypothetical protein